MARRAPARAGGRGSAGASQWAPDLGRAVRAREGDERATARRNASSSSRVSECPTFLVGAVDSEKRTHLTRAVWADLRATLEKVLSGAETEDDVRQCVEEHVAQWRREQDHWWRPRPPSPARVLKGIRTAKAIVEMVNNTPELRQLADTIVHAVHIKWRQRRDAKAPPPSSPS